MTLPGIISQMGMSIAQAQALFNKDYLQNIAGLMGLAERTMNASAARADGEPGTKPAAEASVEMMLNILKQLAPPRYQFTETHLEFSADLVQSKEMVFSGGLSAGYAGVALTAALTYGSRQDYRAAARIRTTLHAVPTSTAAFDTLLARVGSIQPMPLGEIQGVNLELLTEVTKIRQYLGDDVAASRKYYEDEQKRRLEASTPKPEPKSTPELDAKEGVK
ncbi:MAG: hypothetical protein KIT58_07730 [Planctomycetota bacterium]|nr:hypothetical protein [Planctomycetota bacterium]